MPLNHLIDGTGSIRKRLILFFIVIVTMTSVISLYSAYNSSRLLAEIEAMFNLSVLLDEIEEDLTSAHSALSTYVETKSSDSLNDFMEAIESLSSQTHTLKSMTSDSSSALAVNNIQNMIKRYTQYGSDSVLAKRGRDVVSSKESYLKAKEAKDLIQEVIDRLKIEQLEKNIQIYQGLVNNGKNVQFYSVLMVLTAMGLTLLIVFEVTLKMTQPIIRLSKAADEITHGHFEGEDVVVDSGDEVQIMADAFNQMKRSIVGYIDELRDANEVERRLIENELLQAKMQTLLNDAELRSLQSQINPHFLFNSLNAAVQLAMMEEAESTLLFLEHLSTLFRYNIRPLDQLVSVSEEVRHISAYCQLMKMRFGQKVTYRVTADVEVQEELILPMLLQPLVENAFIHGIGKCEDGGHVDIHIGISDVGMRLIVSDTGYGLSDAEKDRILSKDSCSMDSVVEPKRSHSSGIGAGNVVQRIKLLYGEKALFNIHSIKGEGTTVTVELPLNRKEVQI